MKYIFCFLLFVLSTNFLSEAHAHDIQGSKDYPLIERYTGSEIIAYKALPYDRFNLYLGKNASADQTNASQLLEGTVLRIVYRIPKGTTPQNVYEYYQSTLNKSAFAILYQTTSLLIGDNFDVITNHQTEEGIDTPLTRNSINQYYLTAKIKDRFNNELYANIVIGEIKQNSKWRCPWHPSNVGIIHEFEAKKGDIIAVVYLIQPKKLDNKMINITQMQSYETDHDLMGSQDYTNIKRYEGSEIIGYKNISFDRYTLGLSNTLPNSDFSKTLDLEGEITRIVYRIPGDHSSYEILQNYKQTFLDTKFQILYETPETITDTNFSTFVCTQLGEAGDCPLKQADLNQLYLVAKTSDESGKDIYASLLFGNIANNEIWNDTWQPNNTTELSPTEEKSGDVVVLLDIVRPHALEYKMIPTTSIPAPPSPP